MIGGFAMPRSYVHVKLVEKEIFEMKDLGKSNPEIREYFGLSKKQMSNLITRHNRSAEKLQAGILPIRRGRPTTRCIPTEKEKDIAIKQLKMENELLRDFLLLAGRK